MALLHWLLQTKTLSKVKNMDLDEYRWIFSQMWIVIANDGDATAQPSTWAASEPVTKPEKSKTEMTATVLLLAFKKTNQRG